MKIFFTFLCLLCFKGGFVFAQLQNDWENPLVNGINRLPAHSTMYSFDNADHAKSYDRSKSNRILFLNGEWDFNFSPVPEQSPEDFYKSRVTDWDKIVFNSITSGGQRTAYSKDGHNRFTVKELLAPFDQTAFLCKMIYLPPFAIHGTHHISKEELAKMSLQYQNILARLGRGDFSITEINKFPYLNDWIESLTA